MTELEADVDVLNVPIAARCFRGCTRLADIRVGVEQLCARCYQELLEKRDGKSQLRNEQRERRGETRELADGRTKEKRSK